MRSRTIGSSGGVISRAAQPYRLGFPGNGPFQHLQIMVFSREEQEMDSFEMPNCDRLKAGIEAFEKNERRGSVYFEALDHIFSNWGSPIEMSMGVKTLLDIWHLSFYRFGNFDLSLLIDCVAQNLNILNRFKDRSINSLSNTDEDEIKDLFNQFLDTLRGGNRRSPVAVAKSLHLLAPDFFPLWDTDIALGYGSWWVFSEFGASEYIPFCWKIKYVSERVTQCECVLNPNPKRSLLKLIDEYNYSRFTKGWIRETHAKNSGCRLTPRNDPGA